MFKFARDPRISFLVMGGMLTWLGFSEIRRDVWVFKSDLIALKDSFVNGNVTVVEHPSSRDKFAQLEIQLKHYDETFVLEKEIYDNFDKQEYLGMLSKLKDAKWVALWFKKTPHPSHPRKIYQLDTDKETLLPLKNIQGQSNVAIFLLIIGVGLISLTVFLHIKRAYWTVTNSW